MADKNINVAIRKPRKTKGTPLYAQRNYYSAAVLAFSGFCWLLYELWPETRKLKHNIVTGKKFQDSDAVTDHRTRVHLGLTEPASHHILAGLREREDAREDALYLDPAKPKPWYLDLFDRRPDL